MKEVLNLLIANIKVIIHKINMVANEYLLIKTGLSPRKPLGCCALITVKWPRRGSRSLTA